MSSIKQVAGIVIGVVIGLVGGMLFKSSLPPEKDSAAEQLEIQRHELKSARNRLAVLEAERRRGDLASGQAARDIAADIRAGREVDLDDVFALTKPYLADISPLMERMRLKEEKRRSEEIAGEMARKYDLTKIQQARLEDWMAAESQVNAEKFRMVLEDEESDFEDFIRATEENAEFGDLDDFMESELSGEKLAEYKAERLVERSENVTSEANRKLHRLHEVVDLDVSQQDAAFLLFARGSGDYEEGMVVDGMQGTQGGLSVAQRNAEVMSLLRPEQQAQYQSYQAEQREEANRELQEVGLKLPADWDLFEDDLFD
ncbi:hypothetical protein [Roseibacillus persicicus]|uniref:Uncharacterized protein n=1 Tax=Roseibacillus persicicus TaxID=454148 RepID=A0A918TFE5_9BACT|nr:hypothetical protein [Roseibacillus persicicus]GHC45968.1 hypothetical protein GCM10007100_09320 [Roseibacillus persicicus]